VKGDGGLVIVIGGSRAYGGPAVPGRPARYGVRIAAPPAGAAQQAALDLALVDFG
jgi:hypothetical protein